MIKQCFKHSFIASCLLLSLSATESYARSRYESTYQGYGYSNDYPRYGSRLSSGFRTGNSYGYAKYNYRNGYRDGKRSQRRTNSYYKRNGYYGTRYCPTQRRYRNSRRW